MTSVADGVMEEDPRPGRICWRAYTGQLWVAPPQMVHTMSRLRSMVPMWRTKTDALTIDNYRRQ